MSASNTSRKLSWLCAGIVVCLGDAAYALDPHRALSQYVHDRWGPEQGLPRGTVHAITQSADGYLWVGTEAGLVRFDGWKFQVFAERPGDATSDAVLGLVPDREGGLWVRLLGPRLLRFRSDSFEYPPTPLPNLNVTAISRTAEGTLIASAPERGTFVQARGGFERLNMGAALPRSPVTAVAQTTDGTVWVGTRDAGLFRISGGHVAAIADGLPDAKVNCLLPGRDGALWIGTDNGVVRWGGGRLTSVAVGRSQRRLQVLALAEDRDGNLWVGTHSSGLLRVNDRGVVSLAIGSSGANDAVTGVFEDREGSLWIGTAGGLERLRDSAFVTYSLPEGLPADGGTPVFVDGGGRMWFGPAQGGLRWVQDGRSGRVSGDGLETDVVYSIAGRNGEVWLGRQRGGLTQLRSGNGPVQTRTYTQADGLAHNSVYSVHQNRNGTVWAGTLSGGVSRLHRGRFTTYTSANGLAANTVAALLEAADGTMWFATPAGLSSFSERGWRTYTAKDGLPADNVNCVIEDSSGVLWAGTSAGLAFGGAGGFQAVGGAPAALREQILGMAEDRNGSLWVATLSHILRVKRDALRSGTVSEGDVQEFGLADGLRGVEGVKRHSSVVRDPRGRIWFSLNRGISVVDPGRLGARSTPAMVHVQSLSADGRSLDVRGAARIPANSQRVTVGYTGTVLSVPERVRFQYTLDGFDRGWSEPMAAREAVYTNLGPGPYRFRVRASGADGAWSSAEESVSFEIEPAFWQAWWFRVGVVLACMLSAMVLYRLRVRSVTRQLNARFEERLAERTRIAQELHDTLLQGFLSASMQLHVAADRIEDHSPAKPLLNRVLTLVERVTEDGRRAVRGLRSRDDAPYDLGQALSRIRHELGGQDDTEFHVILEGQPRPLHPLIRDEVYRIGREALVNAFRHAHARTIEAELDYTSRQFRLAVRDDGCGIDPKILAAGREGHWGLRGMRERAEGIGGRLQVWSSATAGTEVELSVPNGVAFEASGAEGPLRRLVRLCTSRPSAKASPAQGEPR